MNPHQRTSAVIAKWPSEFVGLLHSSFELVIDLVNLRDGRGTNRKRRRGATVWAAAAAGDDVSEHPAPSATSAAEASDAVLETFVPSMTMTRSEGLVGQKGPGGAARNPFRWGWSGRRTRLCGVEACFDDQ